MIYIKKEEIIQNYKMQKLKEKYQKGKKIILIN